MSSLVDSGAFKAELPRLEIPQQVIPDIPCLQDRIPWNHPLYPATERLRLVGTFNANRKTLAKIEGIFCYNLCWVGCHLMASTEENEGRFNLILTVFFFFQPKYELNCQRPVR